MGKGYSPLSMDDWAKLQRANVVSRAFPRGMVVPAGGGSVVEETPIPTPVPPTPTPTPTITPTQTLTPTPTPTPSATPPSPASITYRGEMVSTANSTEYSFSPFTITEPCIVAVGFAIGNISAIGLPISVNIDGVEMTNIEYGSVGGFANSGLYYLEITGATSTFSISFPANAEGFCAAVHTIENYNSSTPTITDIAFGSGTITRTLPDIPDGSVGLGGAGKRLTSTTIQYTWTNMTETQDRRLTCPTGGFIRYSSAIFNKVGTGDITVSASAEFSNTLILASWR